MLSPRIRYLLLSSSLLFMLACSPAYRQMQPATNEMSVLQKFKPMFGRALYRTKADVVGNHLSGLLLIKKMPDSSLRLVFANEMGFTYFDFEFAENGKFKVHSVMKQMNKKALLKTLQKDFELVLMQKLGDTATDTRKNNGLIYYIFQQTKGYNYYITDSIGNTLIQMERASKNKAIVEAIMKDYTDGIPDTIGITHKTFNFTIGLKRIVQ